MTKLQNVFVALVNNNIFQMTPKLRMFADVCSVCTILFTIKLSANLNLRMATLLTPEFIRP